MASLALSGCGGAGSSLAPQIPATSSLQNTYSSSLRVASSMNFASPLLAVNNSTGAKLGQWNTSLLPRPTNTRRNFTATPNFIQPCTGDACSGGGGGGGGGQSSPPPGYNFIDWNTTSATPFITAQQAAYGANYVTRGTFDGDPGYDIRVDHSDGSTSLAMTLSDGTLAVMSPDGTSTIVAIDSFDSTGATLHVVSFAVPTSVAASSRSGGNNDKHSPLPGYVCAIISGAGGLAGGAIAATAVTLLSGGSGVAVSPWAFRLGAFGGSAVTSYLLYQSHIC